jgi:hypothetical protein
MHGWKNHEVEELLPGSLGLTKFIFQNHGTTHLSREKFEKRIEQRTVRKKINYVIRRKKIAKRIEVKDGYYVNLGIISG